MFKTIKKMLGIEKQDTVAEVAVTDTVVATPKEKIKSAKVKVEPVTVKAKTNTAPKPKRETRKSLEKMTKVQIDELAAERFGAELDRRQTKEKMIEAFMAAQKKAK